MSCCCLDDGVKCDKPGRWTPVLRMYASPELPPAEAVLMGVEVCDEHREARTKPEDWFAEEAWSKLMAGFRVAGRAAPARDLAEVGWQPVSSAPIRSTFWGI